MPPPLGTNWEMFMEGQVLHGPGEIELRQMRPGDLLEVGTKNTHYEFEWREDGRVLLRTDHANRPWGLVKVKGCVFHRSGISVPGVVFRGGKLDYVSMEGQVNHRTTIIASLNWVRSEDRSVGCEPAQLGAAR